MDWEEVHYRLGQPSHLLDLPHSRGEVFKTPTGYMHSNDFQMKLRELEKETCEKLVKNGVQVFIARSIFVKQIHKKSSFNFSLEIENNDFLLHANKIVVATGLGSPRQLPANTITSSGDNIETSLIKSKILDYTYFLSADPTIFNNQTILVFGGGATAAWVVEVSNQYATLVGWVAKHGFDEAINVGQRVRKVIDRNASIELQGEIKKISMVKDSDTGKEKLLVEVIHPKTAKSIFYQVDYLVNCIGQDAYERGGIYRLLSPGIAQSLEVFLDKNFMMGSGESYKLALTTPERDFVMLGAAAETFKNTNKQSPSSAISKFLPKVGQNAITICGVVLSVCAFTNHMPYRQDTQTGKISLSNLNINIMNATQLAVYFTACYPDALPPVINKAVQSFIAERAKTDYGISEADFLRFLCMHFGKPPGQDSCLEDHFISSRSRL